MTPTSSILPDATFQHYTVWCPRNEPGFIAFSSTSIIDGADINFSQPTVLGLSNPFNRTGISTAWGVMISLLCYCFNLPSLTIVGSSALHISG